MGAGCGSACLPFGVSTGGRCQAFCCSGTTRVLALVLWSCSLAFCPLSRLALGALALNMALFRVFRAFVARFMVLVWVWLVLVLCVACVAFVRVWS